MYANCKICGKKVGMTGDSVWHAPCQHVLVIMVKNNLKTKKKKTSITISNMDQAHVQEAAQELKDLGFLIHISSGKLSAQRTEKE